MLLVDFPPQGPMGQLRTVSARLENDPDITFHPVVDAIRFRCVQCCKRRSIASLAASYIAHNVHEWSCWPIEALIDCLQLLQKQPAKVYLPTGVLVDRGLIAGVDAVHAVSQTGNQITPTFSGNCRTHVDWERHRLGPHARRT